MTTETTAVTVIERAAVALGSSKAEAELTALAAKSKDITAITNSAGREECHAAAMVAKNARISVKKVGESARDDANAYVNAVIAEQKRLIGLIEPEEKRLIALRDEWDEKIAAEKAARAEAERQALAAIKERIDNIKVWPLLSATASTATVLDDIARLEAFEVDDSFGASYGEAVEAKAVALDKLREIHAAKVAADVEAARVRDELAAQAERNRIERAELDRQRAEQQQRDAAAQAERAAEEQRLADARAEIVAAQRELDEERAEALNQANAIARESQAKEADRIAAQAAAQQFLPEASPLTKGIYNDERACSACYSGQGECENKAAQQLHDLAVQPDEALNVFAIATTPTVFSRIGDALTAMTDEQHALVLHYCERLIQERQVAA